MRSGRVRWCGTRRCLTTFVGGWRSGGHRLYLTRRQRRVADAGLRAACWWALTLPPPTAPPRWRPPCTIATPWCPTSTSALCRPWARCCSPTTPTSAHPAMPRAVVPALTPAHCCRQFPVFGFGGQVGGTVQHCFPLTFDPHHPEVRVLLPCKPASCSAMHDGVARCTVCAA